MRQTEMMWRVLFTGVALDLCIQIYLTVRVQIYIEIYIKSFKHGRNIFQYLVYLLMTASFGDDITPPTITN